MTYPNQTSHWPEVEEARATELWAEGKSAAEVARAVSHEFGSARTRNAVMGLKSRRGWVRHGVNLVRYAGGSATHLSKTVHQRLRPGPRPLADPPRVKSAPIPVLLGEMPNSRPAVLLDLADNTCHWPLDQGLYCGAPATGSYCVDHERAAHNRNQKRVPWVTRYRRSGLTLR